MKNDNMKSYVQWKRENEKINKNITQGITMNNIESQKLKSEMFKLEVIKLMLEYNLSISHEDEHGAFIITEYKENNAEWFLGAITK